VIQTTVYQYKAYPKFSGSKKQEEIEQDLIGMGGEASKSLDSTSFTSSQSHLVSASRDVSDIQAQVLALRRNIDALHQETETINQNTDHLRRLLSPTLVVPKTSGKLSTILSKSDSRSGSPSSLGSKRDLLKVFPRPDVIGPNKRHAIYSNPFISFSEPDLQASASGRSESRSSSPIIEGFEEYGLLGTRGQGKARPIEVTPIETLSKKGRSGSLPDLGLMSPKNIKDINRNLRSANAFEPEAIESTKKRVEELTDGQYKVGKNLLLQPVVKKKSSGVLRGRFLAKK